MLAVGRRSKRDGTTATFRSWGNRLAFSALYVIMFPIELAIVLSEWPDPFGAVVLIFFGVMAYRGLRSGAMVLDEHRLVIHDLVRTRRIPRQEIVSFEATRASNGFSLRNMVQVTLRDGAVVRFTSFNTQPSPIGTGTTETERVAARFQAALTSDRLDDESQQVAG